jgi:hypothetical protein
VSGVGGGVLVFEVVSSPSSGSVVVDDVASGAFTYAPGVGVSGSDSFTFRVSEDGVWSDPATVSVTVVSPSSGSGERGVWAFDEGVGSVAVDGSGFGNDGLLVGGPSWIDRGGSPALLLDGSSDFVVVADDASLDVGDAMTAALWMRPERRGTQYVLMKAGPSVDGFELSLSSSGSMFVRFNSASAGNAYRVDSESVYPTSGGEWVHLAATFDGVMTRLYVNGVEEASGVGPVSGVAVNGAAMGIGARGDGYRSFQGGIDDARVYDRALTASEIAALAASDPGS